MWRSRYVPCCIEIEAEEGSTQLSEGIKESEQMQIDCSMFDIYERGSFLHRREKLDFVTEQEEIYENSSKNNNFKVNNNSNDSETTVSSSETLEVSLGRMKENRDFNKKMQLCEKKIDQGPITDIRNLASERLTNPIDSNQKSGRNIKSMTENYSSLSACLKDGNHVEQNDSNDAAGTSCEQKHVGKYLSSCVFKVLKAECGKYC